MSQELADRIIRLYQRLYIAMRGSLAEQLMHVEHTMPQLKVLLTLHTDGPSRMGELASALRVSMPTVTGIVDRLVERGAVVRETGQADRRVVTAGLSPEGAERVASLWEASFDSLRGVLVPLPEQDLVTILRGAELMLEGAERLENTRREEQSRIA